MKSKMIFKRVECVQSGQFLLASQATKGQRAGKQNEHLGIPGIFFRVCVR